MSIAVSQPTTVTATPGGLTPEQVASYHENGFIIVENALDAGEIERLNRDAVDICRGRYGQYQGWQGPHDDQADDQVLAGYLCIHFPHKVSRIMSEALGHAVMRDVLSKVIGPNVKCMQSMLFIKASGKPGQAWHQDEYFIPTRDRSLTGGWIALDDATTENGCLWVIPGSHKHGVIWPQHQQADPRFDCSGEAGGFPYTDDDAIAVEVPAGSIVFFNGYLLHRSLPNRTEGGYRRVLVNHYMSAESLLPWGRMVDDPKYQKAGDPVEHTTPVAIGDMRDIVMICGDDPYAWKGLDDRMRPHVRPSGEGGCGGTPKSKT